VETPAACCRQGPGSGCAVFDIHAPHTLNPGSTPHFMQHKILLEITLDDSLTTGRGDVYSGLLDRPDHIQSADRPYREKVRAKAAAFLWWLFKKFELPSPPVPCGQFVIRNQHDFPVVSKLTENGPHTRLWDLIVRSRCVFIEEKSGEWRGSASELISLLHDPFQSKLSASEKQEIKAANWLGRRLVLCQRHLGEAFCKLERQHLQKMWVLHPRPQDKSEPK